MLAAVIAILAVASQGFLAAQAGPVNGIDVEAICHGDSIDKLTIGQLDSLAGQLNVSSHVDCPHQIKAAIQDLANIVSSGQENICSQHTINAIRLFRANYLADQESEEVILPKALKTFAISYGMRASQLCKANMIRTLLGEADEHVRPEDFDEINEWAGEGGKIDQLLQKLSGPDGFILPSDFAALFPDSDKIMHKLAISSAVAHEVHAIKEVCYKRFMPVYEQLVQPAASLTRDGLDYSEELLKSELSVTDEQADKVASWTRIVFLCETMKLVEALKDTDDYSEGTAMFIDEEAFDQLGDKLDLVEAPHNSSEVNHFRSAPVSMQDLELLSDEQIEEVLEDMRSKRGLLQELKEKLRATVMSLAASHLKEEAVKRMLACLRGTSQAEEDVGESTSVSADRQLCGRPASFGGMFLKIFVAAILALVLVLVTSGE